MPFANPFGKYGDGKYVGIPRAEWFKRPEIKSIFEIRFIGRYYIWEYLRTMWLRINNWSFQC